MSASVLIPAPGAKAAKVCGILAIVFAFTCIGIPVAIVLGIVAIVKHGKASKAVKAEPATYEPVPNTGMVTGIISLVLIIPMFFITGIVSAIAIPALLGQRERAREMVVKVNFKQVRDAAELLVQEEHAKDPVKPVSQEAVIAQLLKDPGLASLKNPVNPAAPALLRGRDGHQEGTVYLYPDTEQEGGVTTSTVKLHVTYRRSGQAQSLDGEVITFAQEHVQQHTEDGWQVLQTPEPPPAPER